MKNPDVIIVGAGPAGLGTAAALHHMKIPYLLLEQSDLIGHSWHNHYERLHLHTVKAHSALPFMPFPPEYPTYPSRQQVVDYLTDYARKFDIHPLFNHKVTSINRDGDRWKVKTANGSVLEASHVVLTTGINRLPHSPAFVGQSTFAGTMMHSRKYRTGSAFKGQTVLVVGMGNTGAEIALDLSEQGAKPYISVRGPVNIVPRDFLGRPTQETAIMMAKFPAAVTDMIGKAFRAVSIGDLSRYGIRTPSMPPSKQLRTQGKTPVMDIGTVKAIRAGQIKVKPDIQSFSRNSVLFTDGSVLETDAVILCTGYRPALEDILGSGVVETDQYGAPKAVEGSGKARGLYFVGYDNYSPGGILGSIEKDALQTATAISARS